MTREEKIALLNDLLEIEEKNDIGNLTRSDRAEFQMWVKALEQEPKTGHWIDLKEDNEMSDDDMWRYSCNMCHGQNFRKTLFCPNCGCTMVEPQESEE